MNNLIWLSNDLLNINTRDGWGAEKCGDQWKRSYEIWERACHLINQSTSFDLADGITNLKRSLNHRLKLFEEYYRLLTVNFPNKPKGYLELLESYQLARPFMVKSLMEIRNDIEHNDAPPPSLLRCKELIDIVWYFLKSTDPYVIKKIIDVEFSGNTCDGSFLVSYDVHFNMDILFSFYGNAPVSMISSEKKTGFFPIQIDEYTESDESFSGFVNPYDVDYKKIIQNVFDSYFE
jgi:hypothetical protein